MAVVAGSAPSAPSNAPYSLQKVGEAAAPCLPASGSGATFGREVLGDAPLDEALRRRGYVALRLSAEERSALEAAEAACAALLGSTAEPIVTPDGPRRHPEHGKIVLHGLGFFYNHMYAERRQFHLISAARDICPWPDDAFRSVFEAGEAVLRRLCLELLCRLGEEAVAEWRQMIEADGDPSVCDAFHYPALGEEKAPLMAMSRHFDPGWWTIKQGAALEDSAEDGDGLDPGGLQLWDVSTEAWVHAERRAFFGGEDPRDFAVVFAGERTATFTEETPLAVPAVPHRVVAPRGSKARTSFIFELRDHAC
eukprot:TRINITY_DN47049_c0_g1_i1.p1 TRINITY_DN47049_c0_g1~~TRINITY_DN47049_c0_g1_i1.p1  ORF type:complete len:327 (-),score=62.41 TRINITY_DN47049_c0_g1_i1:62-988(-)